MITLVLILSLFINATAPFFEGERMLSSFAMLNYERESLSSLKKHYDRVSQFLKDKKSQNKMSSDKLFELSKKASQLKNFILVAEEFERCRGSERESALSQGVLSAISSKEMSTCPRDLYQKGSLDAFLASLSTISEVLDQRVYRPSVDISLLVHDAANMGIENSINGIVDLYYRYDGTLPVPKKVADEICGLLCPKSTHERIEKLVNIKLESYLKSPPKIIGQGHVATVINKKLEELNNRLDKIAGAFEVEEDLYSLSGPITYMSSTQKSDALLKDYERSLYEFIATEEGRVLFSNKLQNRIGGKKDKGSFSLWGNEVRAKRHTPVTIKNIAEGTNEIRSDLVDNIKRLLTVSQNSAVKSSSATLYRMQQEERLTKDLKRLIRTNPLSVGEVLRDRPEYAASVCQMIKEIPKDEEKEVEWDKKIAFSTGVIGVGLLVGSGFIFGAAALGATTLGSSTAVMTGTVLAGAGVTLSVAEIAHYGNKMNQLGAIRSELIERAFAGSTKEIPLDEIIKIEEELQDANLNFWIATGSTLPFGYLAKSLKYTRGKISAAKIKEINDLSFDLSVGKYKDLTQRLENSYMRPGQSEVFITAMSDIPLKTRRELLDRLNESWNGDPLQLDKHLAKILNKLIDSKIVTSSEVSQMVKLWQETKSAELLWHNNRLASAKEIAAAVDRAIINPEVVLQKMAEPKYLQLFKLTTSPAEQAILAKTLMRIEGSSKNIKKDSEALLKRVKECLKK